MWLDPAILSASSAHAADATNAEDEVAAAAVARLRRSFAVRQPENGTLIYRPDDGDGVEAGGGEAARRGAELTVGVEVDTGDFAIGYPNGGALAIRVDDGMVIAGRRGRRR